MVKWYHAGLITLRLWFESRFSQPRYSNAGDAGFLHLAHNQAYIGSIPIVTTKRLCSSASQNATLVKLMSLVQIRPEAPKKLAIVV